MNKTRRTRLEEAKNALIKVQIIVQSVKDEEEDAMMNFPENLQNSERFQAIENAIDSLELTVDDIESAMTAIENAIAEMRIASENIQSAIENIEEAKN